jgi:predicted secreted Zn-dependent protease
MKSQMMMRMACGGIAALAMSIAAESKTSQSTNYSYFSISGKSPAAIYASLIKRGPRLNGAPTFATTTAVSTQTGQLRQGRVCEVGNYSFTVNFIIKLPRLQSEAVLPAAVRSEWRSFSSLLKTNAATHRSIWLACAAALEAEIKAVRAPNCKQVDAKATALWNRMKASCSRKQLAFSGQQQRALLRHPFMRRVLTGSGR